jgi:hypothetical protein
MLPNPRTDGRTLLDVWDSMKSFVPYIPIPLLHAENHLGFRIHLTEICADCFPAIGVFAIEKKSTAHYLEAFICGDRFPDGLHSSERMLYCFKSILPASPPISISDSGIDATTRLFLLALAASVTSCMNDIKLSKCLQASHLHRIFSSHMQQAHP